MRKYLRIELSSSLGLVSIELMSRVRNSIVFFLSFYRPFFVEIQIFFFIISGVKWVVVEVHYAD